MFFFAGAAPERRKASHGSQNQVTTGAEGRRARGEDGGCVSMVGLEQLKQ